MSRGMAARSGRMLTAFAAIYGLAAGGCGGELEVDVQLVTKSCAALPALDPLADATQLSVTVYGPGVDTVTLQVKAPRSDGTALIPAIPPGKNRRIVVEALKGAEGEVVARGDSGPIDLSLAGPPIPVAVFLRRVDAFTPAAAAEAPGTCSELVRARAGHSATLLEDGRVLIAGGYTEDGSTRLYEQSTEIYDPKTGVFSPGPDMALQRAFHTATHVPGTSLTVLAGGQFGAPNTTGGAIRVAEVFDESTRKFRQLPMKDARTRHAAAASTANGRVILLGGYDSRGVTWGTSEVFDPQKLAFDTGPNLPVGRAEAAAVPLTGGGIFLIGGFVGDATTGRAEFLRPLSDGSFELASDVSVNLREPRTSPMAALLDGDRVLVTGGFSDHGRSDPYVTASGDLETVAAAGSVGETAASLKYRRGDGGAVGLPDGTVLVAGGAYTDSSGKLQLPLDGEIVTRSEDGALAARLAASGLRDGRMNATWTLLQDGSVLVTGGSTIDKATGKRVYLRSAEIFQPRYVGSKTSPFR